MYRGNNTPYLTISLFAFPFLYFILFFCVDMLFDRLIRAHPVHPPAPHLSFPFAAARLFSSTTPRHKKRMPPKKAPAQEKKTLLGRPSNNLKIGIVGLVSCTANTDLCILTFLRRDRSSKCRKIVVFQRPIQNRCAVISSYVRMN